MPPQNTNPLSISSFALLMLNSGLKPPALSDRCTAFWHVTMVNPDDYGFKIQPDELSRCIYIGNPIVLEKF